MQGSFNVPLVCALSSGDPAHDREDYRGTFAHVTKYGRQRDRQRRTAKRAERRALALALRNGDV